MFTGTKPVVSFYLVLRPEGWVYLQILFSRVNFITVFATFEEIAKCQI